MTTTELWQLDAKSTAQGIATKQFSALDATRSVLARIEATNPRINALPYVLADEALAAAQAADAAVARGDALGALHGVPITVKVNVDQVGCATTDGMAAMKNNIATEDSPLVANLKKAGAVIVGRSNTPAFSLRWFCDNDAHGRTLNPVNAALTPGGSSGGAAAALASGMGAIAHGNDYGGSIRYPAYACGVVGFRPSVGRVPAYNATSKAERGISSQIMSVQGALARTVADATLSLRVMAGDMGLNGDYASHANDPIHLAAPWSNNASKTPCKVALFKHTSGVPVSPLVTQALEQAAKALSNAGYIVEEVAPPHFDEACALWRELVWGDLRRAAPQIRQYGDVAVNTNAAFFLDWLPEVSQEQYMVLLSRRLAIGRAWAQFFAQYPVLLMPTSWSDPAPIDEDVKTMDKIQALTHAQGPMLATAMLGMPGLSIPTGVVNGTPTGVQLCAWRYQEDLLSQAGLVIEHAMQIGKTR